jgi:hypothetical protein
MPDGNRKRSRRRRTRRSVAGGRTRTFKFRVSEDEQRAIRERALGYPTPAEFARRTLTAGWSLPVHRISRITDAFLPIQAAIDLARAAGYGIEADCATAGLREILDVIGDR